MQKFRRYSIAIISAIALLAAGAAVLSSRNSFFSNSLPPARTYGAVSAAQSESQISSEPNSVLPVEVNLHIPFTSQAPRQNWSLPYQEFCEEASALMAASYIKGQTALSLDGAEANLLAVKDFEERKFGFYEDTSAEETAIILREHFGLEKINLAHNPTAIDIKRALAEGKAVIVPVAGRQLDNPFFQQPGPLYHMLVIKGYTKNGDFITNDPGTRRGADYVYKANTIMNAIHDWNGGNVDAGGKVMIVAG